jgi:hypothetical protein
MNKIFEDVGVISSFGDLRFVIDKIENYTNYLEEEKDNRDTKNRIILDLEKDYKHLNQENIRLKNENGKLKYRVKWFVTICEGIIRDYKLSANDLDNLCNMIDESKLLLK